MAYQGVSLVPAVESGLITTEVMVYIGSRVSRWLPRSVARYNILAGKNARGTTSKGSEVEAMYAHGKAAQGFSVHVGQAGFTA
jgi:hypothetical protein